MKKKLLTILFFVGVTSFAFGQSVGDFQSRQSGDWNSSDSWEEWTGSSWDNTANTPTSSSGVISVLNTHVLTVTASVAVDQTFVRSGGSVTINSGATLTAAAGFGEDLTVEAGASILNNGTLTRQSIPVPPPPKVGSISILGTYIHARNGGAIPAATWDSNSTIEIVGITDTQPTGINQVFGNFTWNCPMQTAFFDFSGALTTINGNLEILDNGYSGIYFATSANYTLNVGGDLLITGNSYVGYNSGNTANINVSSDYIVSNGALLDHSFDGDITIDISGDALISNSTINIAYGGTSVVTYNIFGDVDFSGNSVNQLSSSDCLINFVGTGAQVVTGGFDLRNFNFVVGSNSSLFLNSNSDYLGGTLGLTLNAGSRLVVGSTVSGGAIQNSTSAGNIRVQGSRIYNDGSTIEYNGTASQSLGSGFPSSGVNLTINNTGGGVDMSSDLIISSGRTLTLTEGTLNIGDGNLLTLNGTVSTTNGGLSGTALSDLAIGGTGAFGELGFVGSNEIGKFTINRTSSGSVTLANDLIVNDSLKQLAGDINLNGNLLRLESVFVQSGGAINSDAASSFIIQGSGTLQNPISFTGNVQKLRLNRAGANFNTGSSSLSVDSLEVFEGTMTYNAGALSIEDGGYVERRFGGEFSNPLNAVGSFDLLYSNNTAMITGPELPTSDGELNNLTKTGTALLTLGANANIDGVLTLSNGELDASNFTIDLEGDFVSDANATLTNSTFTFSGTTALSGTVNPDFGNIIVENGASFSLSSNLNVAGDLTNNGSLTTSSGTINFNGTTNLLGSNSISVNNVNITTGSSLRANSGANLALTGVFTNNGTFDANNGTIEFNGINSFAGTVPTLANVLIGGSGTLSAPASLTLSGSFTNNGTFDDNDGIINMSGAGTRSIAGSSPFNIYTLNVDGGTVNNNNTGGVSIEDGITVAANTNLDLDGGGSGILTLLSSQSRDAFIGAIPASSSVSGSLNIERAIYAVDGLDRGYHIVGFPATGVTVADIQEEISITGTFSGASACPTSDCGYSVFSFNESLAGSGVFADGYTAFPASGNSESFTQGEGYYIFTYQGETPVSIEGTGSIFSGDFSISLSRTGTSDGSGWHMVSNPYPAATDWSQWGNSGIVGTTAYLWNPSSEAYQVYDGSGEQLIPQGQGFFVRAISNGVNLTATEATKVTSSTPTYLRQAPLERFEIILKTPDYEDVSIVSFNEKATDNFEQQYDAPRLLNTYETLSTLTSDNEMVKVNRLASTAVDSNCERIVKLNFEQMVEEVDYTLGFQGIQSLYSQKMTLVDHFLGTETMVTDDLNYTFQVTEEATSTGSDRFELVLSTNQPTEIATTAYDACGNQPAVIVLENTQSYVNYVLYNSSNEVISTVQGDGTSLDVEIPQDNLLTGLNDFTIKAFASGCDTVNVGGAQLQVMEALTLDSEVDGSTICSVEDLASFSFATQVGATYYVLDEQDTIQTIEGSGNDFEGSISSENLQSGLNEFTIGAFKNGCQNGVLKETLRINVNNIAIDSTVAFNAKNVCFESSGEIRFSGQADVEYQVYKGGKLINTVVGNGNSQSIEIPVEEMEEGLNEFSMVAKYGECAEYKFAENIQLNVEEEINSNLSILTENSCIVQDVDVIIENAQKGKTYTLLGDDIDILSYTAEKDGQITLTVDSANFELGINQYEILIEGQLCQSIKASEKVEFGYYDSAVIEEVENLSICLNESAAIDLSANVEMSNYQVFIGEELVLEEESSSFNLAPTETTTYTLSGTSKNGCEVNTINFTIDVIDLAKPGILVSGNVLESSIEGDSYQWYLDGEILNGEISKILVANNMGDYAVEVSKKNCSAMSDTFVFSEEVLGATKVLENVLKLYPNPVEDKMFVEFNDIDSLNVTIFTLSGKFIDSFELNSQQSEIDMSKFAKGTYLVQFESSESSVTKRIIKQ